MIRFLSLQVVLVCLLMSASFVSAQRKTENVIVITLDGARNQEVFEGLDLEILKSVDKNAENSEVYKQYWAPQPLPRREKLMPFFWKVLMRDHGSIAGNRILASRVETTNTHLFSYPGYSEILTGEARDSIINSNDLGQNQFPSFLDFLQKKMNLPYNSVASISSWDVMNKIATSRPKSFLVNAGYNDFPGAGKEIAALNSQQYQTLSPWPSVRHDYYTAKFALAHMKAHRPRAIHIGFGETDDWAHNKNYGRMIDALRLTDDYIREIWTFVQTHPQYKNKTSIIIVTDHGRGSKANDWHGHGKEVPEAKFIWMAFIGPDFKLRGEWKKSTTIYQNQVAATMVKLMGYDYSEQNPNAGKPVMEVFANTK